MSARSRISPPEAVTLLEEAQCGTASDASSVLQKLSMRLRTPHSSVTSSLHDLLQIHPLQTIPHIPSLIPATPSVVSLFVESFSDLLSADRTLLVPIIGALSDLPLSAAHATQSRATLRYALSVVDAHDLPAVVRALTRLCANAKAPASARWAATALRNALDTPPNTDVIPVLAHVFEEVCRPGNAVGAALRAQAGTGRVSWLDLIVWCHAVKANNGPYATGFKQALSGLSAAVKGPLLAGNAEMVSLSVKAAAPALSSDSTGVREFVRIVADELAQLRVPQLEPVVNFTILVQTLVEQAPTAARGIVQELLAPSRARSVASEAAVLGIVNSLPRDAKQMAVASRNVRVKVAVLSREGEGTSAWSSVFVSIRKGLLFGVDDDRARALALAREIVRVADADVVGELLSVMDSSVPTELGDELAVGFLEIVTVASLRGMVSAEDASRTLDKRIEQHCPKGMLREITDEAEDVGRAVDQCTLHIDVGLIWEQDPAAVATVVSSAASLILARRDLLTTERIAVGMLNVLCLVPVVCIPLYTAVEDCTMEFDTALFSAKRSRAVRIGSKDIPSNVRDTDSQDLVTVISSFAVGMAAILGILNASCICLNTCRRVLMGRRRRRGLEDSADQKVMWTLLERLTEFDRMLNALLLGYEVLQKNAASERKTGKGGKAGGVKAMERSRGSANSALNKADAIRDAVLRGIFTRLSPVTTKHQDTPQPDSDYPRLSLQAIVFSLVAVPDEAGIESVGDTAVCNQTRDIELARIDKVLLRQLLGLTTGRTTEKNLRRGKTESEPMDAKQMDSGSGELEDAERLEGLECLKRIQDAVVNLSKPSTPFPYIDLELDRHENVFMFDDDEFSDEEDEEEDGTGLAAIRWVSPKSDPDARVSEYVRSSTSAVTQKQWSSTKDHVHTISEILHSPSFASLLLDRAATYVAVARKGRTLSLEESFLSNATTVAGLALGCLVAVLRVLPSCSVSVMEKPPSKTNLGTVGMTEIRAFLKCMDEHLITGVPKDIDKGFEECLESSEAHGTRSILTLCWISANSIDAAVSALALEALLVISEFGCLRTGLARHVILSSLTTIYEYDTNLLWAPDDISILFQDTFGEWSLRRRGCGGAKDSNLLVSGGWTPEPAPWVTLLSKGPRRQRSIDRYRLHMFFEGMHVPNALLEACGWIREIAIVMLNNPKEANDGTAPVNKVSFHVESGTEKNDSKGSEKQKHDTSRCQTLLEVTGFRNVIATLMQLVQVSFHTLTLPEAFGVDDALEVSTSPITHWQSALSVLCGILRLYRMNRESLMTGAGPDNNVDAASGHDHDFDHYIVSSSTSVMQLLRGRLVELCSWYSNTATDLSRLSDEVVDGYEKVIGGAALGVSLCSDISAALKREYSSVAVEPVPKSTGADPSSRKPQDHTPSKRKAVGDEDVSRARRIIPRLSSHCDSVTKETQKLAKVMGFRARKALFKLAPPALEEDSSLCFGVGLDIVDEQNVQGEDTPKDDKPDAKMTENNGADMEDSSGSHSAEPTDRRTDAERRPKAITIRFR